MFENRNSGFGSGFSGFSGFDSFDSLGPQRRPANTGIELDTLLELARQRGGAAEELVNELTDPNRSILSTVGNGFKNAFNEFVNIISVPNQIVAGALSSEYTIAEAIKKDIATSDVLYGPVDKNSPLANRIGGTVVRFATDVLLDPTTYITFGAGRGVLGISRGAEIAAGETIATSVGKQAGDFVNLSRQGEEVLNKAVAARRSALERTAEKLKPNLQGDELAAFKRNYVNENLDVESVKKSMSGLIEKSAKSDIESLIKQTTNKSLDYDDAKNAVTAMLKNNPALAETWLDQGGMKVFGKSILSAQRINATISAIPGFKAVDMVMEPVRRTIYPLFDSQWDKDGRISDSAFNIIRQNESQRVARDSMLMESAEKVQKAFKLTNEEWKFVASAIEFRKRPADQKLSQLYDFFKFGKLPADPELQRIAMSGNFVKKIQKVDLRALRELRAPVTEQDNYMAHMLVDNKVRSNRGLLPPKASAQAMKEARVVSAIDPNTGEVIETFFKDAPSKGKVLNVGEARQQIIDRNKATVDKLKAAQKQLARIDINSSDAISSLKAQINDIRKEINTLQPRLAVSPGKGIVEVAPDVNQYDQILGGLIKEEQESLTRIATNLEKKLAELEAIPADKLDMQNFERGLKSGMARPAGRRIVGSMTRKEKVALIQQEIDKANSAMEKALKEFDGLQATDDVLRTDAGLAKVVRATIEEAKAVGFEFDENALSATIKNSIDISRYISAKTMINDLVKSAAWVGENPPSSYRQLSVADMKSEKLDLTKFLNDEKGKPIYFHSALAHRIENFAGSIIRDEATADVLMKFDELQGMVKSSLTTIWPMFHGRNAISNVFLNFMDIGLHVFNPVTQFMSGRMLKMESNALKLAQDAFSGTVRGAKQLEAKQAYAQLMNTKVFTDKSGYSWTYGEFRRVVRDNNIAFNTQITNVDLSEEASEAIPDLFPAQTKLGKVGRMAKKPVEVGQNIGQWVESQARLVNFITNLQRTGDVTTSAIKTKQFLFDYSNLTPFEKHVMRRVFPFYSFTRFNLEQQVRTFLTTPGKTITAFKGIDSIGDLIGSDSLTDKERNLLPDWMKSSTTAVLNRNGMDIDIITGFETPMEQPFKQFTAGALMSSITPFLKVPMELMTGQNFFQGKPISQATNAEVFKSWPDAVKDFIGFTEVRAFTSSGKEYTRYVALRPERMHLILNLPPTARAFTVLRQLQNENVETDMKILQNLIGIRVESVNLEDEEIKKEKELKRAIEDALTQAGVTAQFKRTFVPKNPQ